MSAMKRIGEDMRRDPSQFVNRGNARANVATADDEMVYLASKQGMGFYLSRDELHEMEAKVMTNYAGDRVVVFPLCHMHGEAIYPPVEIELGEKRRKAEAAINERYTQYRKDKKRQGASSGNSNYSAGGRWNGPDD